MQGSFGKLEGGHPKVKTVPIWAPHRAPLPGRGLGKLQFPMGTCEGEESLLAIKVRLRARLLPTYSNGPAHQANLSPRVSVLFQPRPLPPQALTKGFSPIREVSRKACRSPCFMKGRMTMGMGRRPLALLRRLTPGDKGESAGGQGTHKGQGTVQASAWVPTCRSYL